MPADTPPLFPSGASGSTGRIPTTYTIPDPASVEEHGRTYQAYREGKYYLPNDGDEQDRLDLQHKAYLLAMNGDLYWAPIGKPKNVLDIGTGTGIWPINFARQHPQAHIIGTDLSLIQPTTATPPNLTFLRDDAEDVPWLFPLPFDYIHMRFMTTCFDRPRDVLQNAFHALRPGGWLEYLDSALHAPALAAAEPAAEAYVRASPVARALELMRAGLWHAKRRDATAPLRYAQWMRETGFVDVAQHTILAPINSWPVDPEEARIGRFIRMDFEKSLESMVKIFLAAGLREGEIPPFVESVKWSLGDGALRAYFVSYVVYGRKPVLPTPEIMSLGTPLSGTL